MAAAWEGIGPDVLCHVLQRVRFETENEPYEIKDLQIPKVDPIINA